MYWSWTSNFSKYGVAQSEDYRKQLNSNFLIEKLQAMIDKQNSIILYGNNFVLLPIRTL